jgi:hypothetical protein
MGNEFAKNNSVHVRLSRPFYSPGDRVDGTVFLNVVEPFCCTAFFLRVRDSFSLQMASPQ